jgi:hypothetical protein
MDQLPEFEFLGMAACRPRPPEVPNCPQVATNVPGVVAFRDSERPEIVVTMTPASWSAFTDAVKAGEFDLSA